MNYRELGVRRVINACSTATHLGGSIPDPRVMEAMKQAASEYVIIMELQDKAGEIIAQATHSEAALVTSGATSSLQLAAAACLLRNTGLSEYSVKPYERLQPIDGSWREIIQVLPDTTGLPNEVIVQRSHRNPYEFAYTTVGCKLVNAGTKDDCKISELESKINESTTAIAFCSPRESKGLPLQTVIELAHSNDIPVIVDAATSVLPRSNLTKYCDMGADLVAISGGKQIKGPNDTGILCGRRALIELAKLQVSPFNGIGRGMKVDRSQIIGLLVALEIFLQKTSDEEEMIFNNWQQRAIWITEQLRDVKGVQQVYVKDSPVWEVRAMIVFEPMVSAFELAYNLRKGDPSIWVETSMSGDRSSNEIGIATDSLNPGEGHVIVNAIKEILKY